MKTTKALTALGAILAIVGALVFGWTDPAFGFCLGLAAIFLGLVSMTIISRPPRRELPPTKDRSCGDPNCIYCGKHGWPK